MSRLRVVEALGREVSRRREIVFELAGVGPGLGTFARTGLPPDGKAALRATEDADALVVGSPICKGSYTGLFTRLFDFVGPPALAVEHQLRPLFRFFSALTLPMSVYAGDEDFSDGVVSDRVTLDRIGQAAAELVAHARPAARAAASVSLQRVA